MFGSNGKGLSQSDIDAITQYNNQLKQGVTSQTAWNRTMLQASPAAQHMVSSANGAAVAVENLGTGAVLTRWQLIKLQAASMALNIAISMGVMLAIRGIIKGIDYLIHRTEKMQEALENSVSEFNSVTDELKSLEEELKTTTERLAELQKLADNGTISVAEEAELETLKKTNKELARRVALKQQEQAQEARDVLKDSKKNATSKVDSEYKEQTASSGNYTYKVDVLPSEELEMAINAYNNAEKALSNPDRNKEWDWMYEDNMEKASNRIEEMYALISPTIEAYEDLIDAGIELEGEDKTRYEQLKKSQDAYLAYIYTLNGTKEAFEGLNVEQQRNVLLNKLIKQGLSEDVAKAIIGSISNEDLSKYWDKNFSFVPPEMKDDETAEEYGKRYAEAWAKGLEEGAKNANEMTVSKEQLEKEAKILKNRIDKITQSLSEYTKQLELLKKAQDDLYEDDYIGKLDYVNKRYEVQSQYTADAKKELDSLLATVPTSTEGWEDLASAVEKVSQQYFESRRAMIDYGVEMAETYMNAAKAVGEFSNALIDESTSQYDRNVKMLTEGGLGGLQFSLTPVVPEDAVEKQREENEKLLKEEKIYQEKVNQIKHRALDEQLESATEIVNAIKTDTTDMIEDLGQKAKDTYDDVSKHIDKNPLKFKVDDGELKNVTNLFEFLSKGTTSDKILNSAKKYLNTPYVWGGDKSSEGGLDCSGYVYNVLKDAGLDVQRTTAEGYRDLGNKVNTDELQPGDLLFFGKNGNASHVAIYAGNGQMYESTGTSKNTIKNPGKGVVLSDISKRNDLIEARRVNQYADGTKDYGIAGENYKREYLIDKKTGQWTAIDSPTLIDTNEVEVVGEKASAKINKPIPMYADGTLSNTELLNIIKRVSEESGVPANVLMAVAQQETGGKWYDKVADGTGYSYGYMMLYDNGVIADLKAQGRNETAEKAKTDPYTNVSIAAEYLKKFFEQGGSWQYAFGRYNGSGTNGEYAKKVYERMNSSEYIQAAQNIGLIADDTKYIRRDFATQIKDIINGSTNIAGSEQYEDNLLAHIIENTSKSNKSAENYVANFEKLNAYQKEMEGYFAERDKELLASVGTPRFASLRDEIAKEVSDYTNTIMGMSVDMETSQIKDQYEYSKALLDSAMDYYNLKKSEGASAEELAAYANGINEIKTQVNELSDAYVEAIQNETEFLKTQADNKMKLYSDDLSWVEQNIEDAEYNDDVAGQIVGYQSSNKILSNKKNAAHQGVLDLYKNEEYAPIFERFDIESWFDANGETTAKFAEDIARMGLSEETSHLVPLMQQIAELVGIYKQEWYEADEAIKDNAKSIADLKIEEHLNSLDFKAQIKDATINAKQSLYDFMDTLREEERSITAELKKNMQIDDWLSEDTRKLLFNEEDYAKQMDTINGLREEANDLYVEYQREISSLSEDELWKEQAITDEYNRQMEVLQDKLDIANKELKLAKDKAAFENALLERDTQIIMGNRVQNVADPERLRQLAQTAAESELELEDAKIDKTQNDDIRMLEGERSAIQSRIDMINDMTALERLAYAERLGLDGNFASDIINKINDSAISKNAQSSTIITGDYDKDGNYGEPTVEYVYPNKNTGTPLEEYLANYTPIEYKDILSSYSNGKTIDTDALKDLVAQTVITPERDLLLTNPTSEVAKVIDNSIAIENVNLTLEDIPDDPNKAIVEFATKLRAINGITKNR